MFLEDRILKIIELKENNLDNKRIAAYLDLDENTIKNYYDSAKEILSRYAYSGKDIATISEEIKLSIIATTMALNHYNIDLSRKTEIIEREIKEKKTAGHKPRKERVQEIKNLKEQGKTLEEISKEIGLVKSSIQNYACQEGISLAEKTAEHKPRKERIQEISELIPQVNLEEIAEKTGLSIHSVICFNKDLNKLGLELPPLKIPSNLYSNLGD